MPESLFPAADCNLDGERPDCSFDGEIPDFIGEKLPTVDPRPLCATYSLFFAKKLTACFCALNFFVTFFV